MCGNDPFAIYDYILDRQCAEDMGFNTVQDLYEAMNNDRFKTINESGIGTEDIRSS